MDRVLVRVNEKIEFPKVKFRTLGNFKIINFYRILILLLLGNN